MTTEATVEQEPAAVSVGAVTDEQLISMLVDRARGDGLKLTGEGGLLQQRRFQCRQSHREAYSPAGHPYHHWLTRHRAST